ncbi:MAG: insulinase family protein [Chitinispirillaceae bacterium]|nr:insulinase family protein [Chitinispirillaceae bacterium]
MHSRHRLAATLTTVAGSIYFYPFILIDNISERHHATMTTALPEQHLTEGAILHGFRLERIRPITELQTTAYLFHHFKSGAHVIHLSNNDPDNLFSIALRTPVHNSTGVPHILEHSVLCGSRRYPVKDPFQEMLKGSMQTFLNALTYPDKTVYPVSSQVEKDFFNLASIYADAVFNPLLSENTFYQEGWHFDVEDIDKPFGIKGIVYNEMKGVFSNFASHVDRKMLSALFPDTTYHFESGGDPEHITDLSYEQFVDFHRRYYHPSNAFIILYGNIPSDKALRFLNETYLNSFTQFPIEASVKPQPLWDTPRSSIFEAPAPQEDRGTATVAVAWIFGDTTDPVATLTGQILSYYLLKTEGSPLKRALIDSGLGEDLADISGFDSELRQTVFAAGLRKTKPEHAGRIEDCILATLDRLVRQGLDPALLEGSLRRIEFNLREVTGGHFPYNLRIAERCYRSWMYGGDPFAHCAFEKPLSAITAHLQNGDTYFADCIRTRLLGNRHRLCVTITASPEMGNRLEQQTAQQAARLSATFSSADKERYVRTTRTLLEQQKAPSPPEALALLPKLDISDLPRAGAKVPTALSAAGDCPLHLHPLFTSGIVYLDLGFDLGHLPGNLIPYIPLYCEYTTRCGAAGLSYEQMATRIALSTGGIDASVTGKTVIGTHDEPFFRLVFHAKSLLPRFGATIAIMHDLLTAPDLAHEKLIRDIVLEERNSLNSAIINAGHHFALTHAASGLLRSRAIDEQLHGITQLRFLEALVRNDACGSALDALRQLHESVINRLSAFVVVTADDPETLVDELTPFLDALPATALIAAPPPQPLKTAPLPVGIEISSAVNFVGRVWKLPPVMPETAGQLLLMGRILSAGYLWDKVRVEGGAYGGMSSVSIAHPLFSCASYRDPNLAATVHHFTKGLKQVAAGLPQKVIDQNIIGTIGHIDAPLPPHARGLGESIALLTGNTPLFRQQLRDAVFSARSSDLASLARSILDTKENVTTVLGSAAAFEQAGKEGFACSREPLLPSGGK